MTGTGVKGVCQSYGMVRLEASLGFHNFFIDYTCNLGTMLFCANPCNYQEGNTVYQTQIVKHVYTWEGE